MSSILLFFKKSISIGRIFNWLIVLIISFFVFKRKDWEDPARIIRQDVNNYYLYLPAVFIYNDIYLDYADTAPEEVKSKVWYKDVPDHGRVGKMSAGMAMCYSPFFLVAHLYALTSEYDANGYTLPYRFGMLIGTLFFLGIGLYYVRKTLSLYFPSFITILVCISLVLGTNIFYYCVYEPCMTHIVNFCLISAFVYYSILWNKSPSFKLSIVLGILIGLISLTRPSNIIIVLFLFFWDVKSLTEFVTKIKSWLAQFKFIVVIGICAFLVWLPQLLYWKAVTGDYFYYSYGNEGFFFNNPIIFRGLFSYRSGWLVYTPIMAFALIGIGCLRKQLSAFFWPTLLFILLNIYIIFSWWCWWYGGSFGARALIDCYGLMAVPMAALFHFLWGKNKIAFAGFLTIVIALIQLNLFQSKQREIGSIHWDSQSKAVYWANFGKLTMVPNFQELIDPPNYEDAMKGIR